MRHVLFVDDDIEVLSAMRRALHDMRGRWRMTFVSTGAEALTALARCPADVVVTDMRMPGLDGAQLLSQVRAAWPETVRIVLSGFADDGAALRSVPVAHQFLSKPCDAATLAATLTRAYALRDRLSRPDLRQLIGGLGTLPSAPGPSPRSPRRSARPRYAWTRSPPSSSRIPAAPRSCCSWSTPPSSACPAA